MRLPDFIIGGAPRTGTTWLYQALDRHPEIFMAKPFEPEPKFFLVDEIYKKGIEYYSTTWFSSARPSQRAGEKSTNYLESPIAAERIKMHLPNVKLIFILRDPVERAFSNYLWSRHNQLETEDFKNALALEAERERRVKGQFRFSRPHAYFSRGVYVAELKPYFDLFDRKRILCLRFEDLEADASTFLVGVHQFLEVECRPNDAMGLGKVRQMSDENQPKMPEAVREELYNAYKQPNRELAQLLGEDFIEPWRSR